MTRMIATADDLREYKKQYNFFETSQKIATIMGGLLARFGRNVRFLDPSAGRGMLIKSAIPFVHPASIFDYCEIQEEFDVYLEPWNCVGEDFLQYNPGRIYDAIIMNPPYSNKQAERHTDHAWNCVKPGGWIVTLVGVSAAKYIDEEYFGHIFDRQVFKKGFAETGIDTVLFLINVPLY